MPPGLRRMVLPAAGCRQQVSDVKDAMNASAAGGSAARRIAGEAGREYVLHKEPQAGAAPATAAAAAAQDAATDADGVGSRQAGPAAAPKAPAAAPAAAAAASAALPAAPLPGQRGNALDICFDVELEDGKSDEGEPPCLSNAGACEGASSQFLCNSFCEGPL